MSRIVLALAAAALFLGGGLVTSLVSRPATSLTEQDVRSIAESVVAESISSNSNTTEAATDSASIDASVLNPMIESYLTANPRILERMSVALQAELTAEKTERTRVALSAMSAQIYDDPDHVVLGNPEGDVTLVELYDYNCGYCRKSVPDIATLLAEDKNLRIIFKEFPILSQDSMDAARIAVAVSRTDADYWQFHTELFSGRGKATAESALDVAKGMGLNPVELQLDAQTQEVADIIQKSYAIAEALDITGTPAYILGDEIIAGAVGVDALRLRIANVRACGKTICG